MNIDPAKTTIQLIVECSECRGTGVKDHVKVHPTGNTGAYQVACSVCTGLGKCLSSITIAEFLKHLVVPTTVDLHCTVDNPVQWRG